VQYGHDVCLGWSIAVAANGASKIRLLWSNVFFSPSHHNSFMLVSLVTSYQWNKQGHKLPPFQQSRNQSTAKTKGSSVSKLAVAGITAVSGMCSHSRDACLSTDAPRGSHAESKVEGRTMGTLKSSQLVFHRGFLIC